MRGALAVGSGRKSICASGNRLESSLWRQAFRRLFFACAAMICAVRTDRLPGLLRKVGQGIDSRQVIALEPVGVR